MGFLPSFQGQSRATVLDGVYSDAQALRGKTAYTTFCSACHGSRLEGVSAPSLTDKRFIDRWREGTLDGLYDFIRQRMSFGRAADAKRISDAEYLDILTYVLNVNGYPAGPNELSPGGTGKAMLVGKNGPQPVPDGAHIVTVGCLAQRDGVWSLSNAAEPSRSPTEAAPSADLSLGTLTFRLADLEAVPDFSPDMHLSHRMRATGYLVRQPNAERISLTSIEMIGSTCMP